MIDHADYRGYAQTTGVIFTEEKIKMLKKIDSALKFSVLTTSYLGLELDAPTWRIEPTQKKRFTLENVERCGGVVEEKLHDLGHG